MMLMHIDKAWQNNCALSIDDGVEIIDMRRIGGRSDRCDIAPCKNNVAIRPYVASCVDGHDVSVFDQCAPHGDSLLLGRYGELRRLSELGRASLVMHSSNKSKAIGRT